MVNDIYRLWDIYIIYIYVVYLLRYDVNLKKVYIWFELYTW